MATIDGRTLDHNTLEHIRIQAVRRVIEDGKSPGEVMRGYGLCRTTIYPWLRDFKDKGWEALAESIHQGPEPKMTEKQRQQVARWILAVTIQLEPDFGANATGAQEQRAVLLFLRGDFRRTSGVGA
jgi:transposase-like protein